MHVTDGERGISMAIRNFVEEYPKEIQVNAEDSLFTGYFWSPEAGPMSFERANTRRDGDMVGNFATGIAKTTELSYYFHTAEPNRDALDQAHALVLDAPAAHAEPSWYGTSGVFATRWRPGHARKTLTAALPNRRALSLHFRDWFLFNPEVGALVWRCFYVRRWA